MNIPYFDAHSDTIFACERLGGALRKNSFQLDLMRLGAYAPRAQVFAVWARPVSGGSSAVRALDFTAADTPADILCPMYERVLDRTLREFAANSDILTHCLSAEDAKQASKEGKLAAFITVEGAELLKCDVNELSRAYVRGVRLVNLCWNFDNALCGSSRGAQKGGLTAKGRDFVREAQDMGVIVDLSHSSDAAFWDTLEIARRPVLAGHSNSRYIFDCPRNLTDEMFQAIVKNGGVVGMNFCADFLGKDPDIDTFVSHAEHFLSLGGTKNVAIGGDLDGIDAMPKGMSGVEDVGKVYEAMLKRNWSEDLVRDIFYNNLMRVFGEAL